VALLAAGGLTSRAIAQRLFLSVRTVDNHLQRAYAKLGVNARDQIASAPATSTARSGPDSGDRRGRGQRNIDPIG
jgi:DNA-binding NarL/FixJ family response regulator